MSTISFKNINKIYNNNVQAVFNFNLEVKDKEFIVLVGPSGCGKSTTLRMLAGLEDITTGELYIDGKLVNNIAPKNRDIAMVFQNYALYPHMSVYDNMAFSLKMREIAKPVLDENGKQVYVVNKARINVLKKEIKKLEKDSENNASKIAELNKQIQEEENHPSLASVKYHKYTKEEIDEKIKAASAILGLDPYLDRKPSALSGGQCQRVALGRSIVRSPKVFLMDEPLSNLDAKLRVSMRSEISKIHERVGATTVYVTHDQTEAMTMASRIVVMKDGWIQQIGTPREVYTDPNNMFVAGFIGAPSMNFIKGTFDGKAFKVNGANIKLELSANYIKLLKDYVKKEVILGIRPEDMYLENDPTVSNPTAPIEVRCDISELLGYEIIVYGYIGEQKIIGKLSSKFDVQKGDVKKYVLDTSKIAFFDPETTMRVR